MEMSKKMLKKRKALLALPLLVIPFLTLSFYALGGGQGVTDKNAANKELQGLNLNLPSANLKEDKKTSKLSFYEKMEEEERQREKALQNDPYFQLKDDGMITDSDATDELEMIVEKSGSNYKPDINGGVLNTSPVYSGARRDPNEVKILEKLKLLEKEMNQPQPDHNRGDTGEAGPSPQLSGDVKKLEEMMQMMTHKDPNDPELQQLEGMLDKILDIQYPERMKEKLKVAEANQEKEAFPVNKSENNSSVSLLGNKKSGTSSGVGFYGTANPESSAGEANAIEAVIHDTRTLVNGSVIKLRLLHDIYVNDHLIPQNNFVFGIASLNGERLTIDINSIRHNNSVFPVKMKVYDLDGLEGIYIPGAITRDVAKQSGNNALQMMEMTTLDPSLAAQATSAGISTVKNLLSKKIKLIKVNVKMGYKVLLKDMSRK